VKEFARREKQRASRALQTAAILVTTDPESAVSRAYYAAFSRGHSLYALCAGEALPRTPPCALPFTRTSLKPMNGSAELGKDYDLVMSLRQTGDYGGAAYVSGGDARRAVEAAQRIIVSAKAFQSRLICVHPRNPRGKSELSPVIWFDPWPVTPEPRRRRVNSLSARARRRFFRTAARRGADPRPGTVLRRRSSA